MTAEQINRFAALGASVKAATSGVEITISRPGGAITVIGTIGPVGASLDLQAGGFDTEGTLAAYIPASTPAEIGDRVTTGGTSYLIETLGTPGPAERRLTLRPDQS
jgi:hypothetical protein